MAIDRSGSEWDEYNNAVKWVVLTIIITCALTAFLAVICMPLGYLIGSGISKDSLSVATRFIKVVFENPDYHDMDNFEKQKVKAFIDTGIFKGAKEVLKEYEFIYTSDKEYHGIIDLLLIFEDHSKIIDYKLKNTSDDAYLKQLNGYKNYIENMTGKKAEIYLYSIIDEKLVKL